MRSDEIRHELGEEFPELLGNDLTLQKEVYAHFGLAFMKFGLVEHSLINVITFHRVAMAIHRGKVSTQEQWEFEFDQSFKFASLQSLGNLVKLTSALPEFSALKDRMYDIKRLRDYFAHHFMREEATLLSSDEGSWILLKKIADVRQKTLQIEDDLKPAFEAMCRRYGYTLPSDKDLRGAVDDLKSKVTGEIEKGVASVGWERDAL